MKIGRMKSTEAQGTLYDYDRLLETTGAKRSWVGDFFEELTAKTSGARRVKTSGDAEICPDLRFDPATFFECKGIGLSGQAIMYEDRFKKDRRFINEHGVNVYYWFWRHNFGVMQADSMNSLRAGLASTVATVGVIDRRTLEAILKARPKRRINSRYMKSGGRNGYGEEGYGIGWAFPIKLVLDRCPIRRRVVAQAYGERAAFQFCAVDFFCLDFLTQ